jgi:F-type H+-transporting ATPase subunit b
VSDKKDLYPQASELIVGAVAFAILFYFMWKWVIPRVNTLLEERRAQIQGQLESAEQTRQQAEGELAEYRKQLASAREDANRIIEEARETAEQFRRDIQAKAEEESRNTVARAQDEIRAERDRVFNELRVQVADIAVTLAGRVVGAELDTKSHQRLIDEYIEQVASGANGQGG